MANIIQIKHGATVPTRESLKPNELGFDTTNKVLYIGTTDKPLPLNNTGGALPLPLPIEHGGTGAITEVGAYQNIMQNWKRLTPQYYENGKLSPTKPDFNGTFGVYLLDTQELIFSSEEVLSKQKIGYLLQFQRYANKKLQNDNYSYFLIPSLHFLLDSEGKPITDYIQGYNVNYSQAIVNETTITGYKEINQYILLQNTKDNTNLTGKVSNGQGDNQYRVLTAVYGL